jgi:hypothetical protein
MILWFNQYQFSHTSIFENATLILDNSTVVLLVVLVAMGVAVLVGARVLKARKQQQP